MYILLEHLIHDNLLDLLFDTHVSLEGQRVRLVFFVTLEADFGEIGLCCSVRGKLFIFSSRKYGNFLDFDCLRLWDQQKWSWLEKYGSFNQSNNFRKL